MKKFILSFTLVAAALPAAAALSGQWYSHPTFDNSVIDVIDTPTRTYFTGYPHPYSAAISYLASTDMSLFYFDKEGEEIVAAYQRHDLSAPTVQSISYNPVKGYLLVTYSDQDIDLLYDDGSVANIGALKNASLAGSKNIRSVFFDAPADRIWIATDFGYVLIDDERLEVADSRNYGEPINTIARIGDDLYIVLDQTPAYTDSSASHPDANGAAQGGVFKAKLSDGRRALTDYSPVTEYGFNSSTTFYPLGDSMVMCWTLNTSPSSHVASYRITSSGLDLILERDIDYIYEVYPCKDGYTAVSYGSLNIFSNQNGTLRFVARHDDEKGKHTGAGWDNTYYNAYARLGLREYTIDSSNKMQLTRNYMRPNAPTAFLSRNFLYHPTYGMLTGAIGIDHVFSDNNLNHQFLLSGLKNRFWTPYGFVYRNNTYATAARDQVGMAIDPDDSRYLYIGSNVSGITRINMEDAQDVICYTHPADALASTPGYVKLGETSSWARIFSYTEPQFDADNTLWVYNFDYDTRDSKLNFNYLTAADRRASSSAASARPWKKMEYRINGLSALYGKFLALRNSVNRNILLYMGPNGMVILNHNGTPDNTTDDTMVTITKFTDQDGNSISYSAPNQMYEDPSTGVVWISNSEGLFYATPRNLMQGQAVLNRVKVSRNDGTSLADYLLNGVEVNAICRDGADRMWIATTGAGIVVTSSDGKLIYDEFSKENSGLPSNTVYDIAYNPDDNSILMSTEKGIVEFFIGGSASNAGASDQIRAYPNPVAPDYYGWVTIDGLPDNSLVKIADSRGTIVRELGRAEGGSIQWDLNNLQFRRVQTGVYYILASPTGDSGSESRVGKVLVMN
ncbi:MAG: hypothetical protein K2H21_07425 [Muribaculaceae bacterium]|nr:hypothetical protein [Muribaculaceae bacterium]